MGTGNGRKKLTGKLAAAESAGPRLVPQPNGGALKSGGTPGHRGAGGRPRSELRNRMCGSLDKRLGIAEQIADNRKSAPSDRLRALEFMAKYGLGITNTETDAEGNDVTVRVRREPKRAVG